MGTTETTPSLGWRIGRGLLRALGLFVGVLLVLIVLWVAYANVQIARTEQSSRQEVATGRFIDVDGYQLHVRQLGTESQSLPLVMIHGFTPLGSVIWGQAGAALAEERPVILIDLLGFGASQRVTEPVEAYTIPGQARLVAHTLDALGIARADVMGTSYGGGVAARLALLEPERVNRLLLVDAQVYAPGGGFFQKLATIPLGVGRALAWTAQGGGPLARLFYTQGCSSGGYCPDQAAMAIYRRFVSVQDTSDALVAFSAVAVDTALAGQVPGIRAETLVVWGADDAIIPLADGERLAQEIPGAELVVLPGAGHAPYLEQPAPFVEAIRGFLRK